MKAWPETMKDKKNYGGLSIGAGGEEAEAIALDSLNIQNVSFIKVDVQGAEHLMLFGAQVGVREYRCSVTAPRKL